jgi:diguanylate cyclase (GGDEF)-like protein/PAS domain S-box-containing protein
MLGFRDNELKNQTLTWYKRVHHDDKKNVFTLLREHQDNQIKYFEFNHRLKHRDGHWVWVLGRAQILFDKNGKKVRMIGTHTDITEEKELQLKYIYQAQIIEQVHDSIITTDLDGNIVSWNLGSEKIFGYTASETINENISMIYRQEDISTYTQYIPTLMKKGIYNADMYFVKKSKELIPISFSLSLLKDENGNPIGVVSINKDNTQRKKAEAQLDEQKSILYHQAHHDALTGLPNRVLLFDRLKQSIIKAKHHSEKLALFFIDLDKFKYINDSLGHDIGDSVLKIISKRLKNIVSTEDTVARLSGDEFTIILDDLKNLEDASILAEKILKILKEPMYIDNHTLYVSGSIGISIYPDDGTDGRDLLKYSDTAMYKSKEEGRNNFQFYSSTMTEFAMNRIVMKTNLQKAINGEELLINYQPQINSCTDKLVGIEALIRWNHPTKGLLMPDKFIPLAEDTGMIIELDKWVMSTTMKQVSNWYKEGLNPGVLGLNLSVKQLESHDFIQVIKDSINKYDFKAEWLELEVTEAHMMTKPKEVISRLREINNLGIAISIDDFGTGYSSLSLLKKLPINKLKIDKSFIKNIPESEENVAIVNAIIALANSLKLDLIAEGVETPKQKDFLINNGCINMQGYYFSHPVSSTEMRTILLNKSSNP